MTEVTGAPDRLRIDVQVQDEVAQVRFERAGVLNAWGQDDLPALADAIRSAGSSGARVVVIRGAGGAFSAGDDLKQTALLDDAGWRDVVEGFHDLTRVVWGLDVPVICAIDGACVGGAFEFACSCDMRIATNRSRFGCPEVSIGIAISNGASVLLGRLCGAAFAAELTLTGRLVDADEALRRGIVNQAVPADRLDEAVAELAARVAAQAPLAVQATKRLLIDPQQALIAHAMEQETAAGSALFATEDFREGLAAFREKRAPVFRGR
jgi:enoyl-CoA hydratase/carnithine racemase